jgi:hypothetical protein
MAILADTAADAAAGKTLDIVRTNSFAKMQSALVQQKKAINILDGRIQELSARTEGTSANHADMMAEWKIMRERWDGMLRYCYRVCKHDAVKALAEIDPPNPEITRVKPWDARQNGTITKSGGGSISNLWEEDV